MLRATISVHTACEEGGLELRRTDGRPEEPRRFLVRLLGLSVLLSLVPLTVPDLAKASDVATRWEHFSESTNCGSSYTKTPYVSRRGGLSDSELILGPFGSYFGHTVGEVRSHLVDWPIPGSNGITARVHEAMLPSLRQVAASLEAERLSGRTYRIRDAGAHHARTIGGSYQISRHALGLALDINPAQNPYRSDNKLITNMPTWFVDAWRSAGFCWGGDWERSKDPMHFSWMGPGATPVDSDFIEPMIPRTSKTLFGSTDAVRHTEFAGAISKYSLVVADGTGNAAPDIIGLRPHNDGMVIDISTGTYAYEECSITRWFVPERLQDRPEHLVYADIDGDSGSDLIVLTQTGPYLEATVATRLQEFEDPVLKQTGLSSDAVSVAGGDFDGDGVADLWEVLSDSEIRIWKGPAFSSLVHQSILPRSGPVAIAVGDRDGGDTPEVFVLFDGGSQGEVAVMRHEGGWAVSESFTTEVAASEVVAMGAADYDGDGRADLQVLDVDGRMIVHIGNSFTGASADRWFVRPDRECDGDSIPLIYSGSFFDDDGSIFESHIDAIAQLGVTKGCNRPFNDEFCPKDVVTRETMAAFLVRALGLTEDSHPGFDDVAHGSLFASDIGRLATAGITKGCNPPLNDEFCPKDVVTRETMAAFLDRAGFGR